MTSLGHAVGHLVRVRRNQRGMTAAELARRAGISKANLSAIETGRGNPTLDTLEALAGALAIPLVDLLDVDTGRGTVVVTAKHASDEPISRHLLHRLGGGHSLEVWHLRMAPGEEFTGVPHAAGTVEQLFLTGGGLTAGPDGDRHDLAPGDLIAFDGELPHTYTAHEQGADGVVLLASPAL